MYAAGIPLVFASVLVLNRNAIFKDQQLLLANTGHEEATNDHFRIRVMFGSLYRCVQHRDLSCTTHTRCSRYRDNTMLSRPKSFHFV